MSNRISISGNRDGMADMVDKIESKRYVGYAEFKKDLEEAYGITGHPKAGILFIIAFHHGNLNGHYGILKWYDELVHLLS